MKKFMKDLSIAKTISKEAIKRDGIGKYYLYFIMNFLFGISIFLSPFRTSKWEMASEIKKGNKISLTSIYDNSSGKRYFNLLLANVLKLIIFLSVLVLIALFSGLLYGFGLSIFYFSDETEGNIVLYWLIPGSILVFIFLVIMPYIQVPNSYIINKYSSLSPSRILKFSFYAYKNGGKKEMFLINLFDYGLKTIIVLPFLLFGLILYYNVSGYNAYGWLCLFVTLGLLCLLIAYPFISLIALIMRNDLLDEIVFVKNSNKYIASFEFEIDINDKNKTLNNMFDLEEKEKDDFKSYEDKLNNEIKKDKKRKMKESIEKSLNDDLEASEQTEEIEESETTEEAFEDKEPEEEETIEEAFEDKEPEEEETIEEAFEDKEPEEEETKETTEEEKTSDEPLVEEKVESAEEKTSDEPEEEETKEESNIEDIVENKNQE